MRAILFAGLLLLGACAASSSSGEAASNYTPISFAAAQATPAEKASCEKAGGEVRRAGRRGNERCVQPYPDAGKVCADLSDCLGRCLLTPEISDPVPGTDAAGQCQADDDDFGCVTLIEGGKIKGTICVD